MKEEVKTDPAFKAMILVRAEIQEVKPDGRYTNMPLIRPISKVISIGGGSLDECEEKVKKFMGEMKDG